MNRKLGCKSVALFLTVAAAVLLAGTRAEAQNVSVVSLEELSDSSTLALPEVLDANAEPCALLKIKIGTPDIAFKSDWIVKSELRQADEHWVWLCEGTRDITVTSNLFLPFNVVFASHNKSIKGLKARRCYLLTLAVGTSQASGGTEVEISSAASPLEVYVDGRNVALGTVRLDGGKHVVTAYGEAYEPFEDTLDVNPFIGTQRYTITMEKRISDPQEYIRRGDRLRSEKRHAEALRQYRLATQQGHGEGFLRMGKMHEWGWGVEQDFAEAAGWYTQGSALGHAPSMAALAELYRYGYGKPRDYARALDLYRKAIAGGCATALADVGELHELGLGVAKNVDSAVHYYKAACKRNDAKGQYHLADYYASPGPHQDCNAALKLYRKAADQDYSLAMASIGILHEYGICVKKDTKTAVLWYSKALAQRHPMVYVWVADYIKNYDTPRALSLYLSAAKCGEGRAMYEVGRIYDKAEAPDMAIDMYRQAAAAGYGNAFYRLGAKQKDDSIACRFYRLALENGATGYDREQAQFWLESWSAHGYAPATYHIGVMYETGKGFEQNLDKAVQCYRESLQQWHYEPAAAALKRLGLPPQ